MVASRRLGNPVGWALCSIGLSWGEYHFSSEYVTYALLAAPGSLPAAKAAAWIASWLWVPGLGLSLRFNSVVGMECAKSSAGA